MYEKRTNFSQGLYVAPGARPKAYRSKSKESKMIDHSRIRHDHATWHPDHLELIERKNSTKLPYADRSKFDSTKIIEDAISKSNLHHAYVGKHGNFVVVFDIGYQAGPSLSIELNR